MFFQVFMSEQYRDYTRFVWFKDGELSGEIEDLRMAVHLFGMRSSPGCANFALKVIADLHEPTYGKDAADFLRDCFYVDDGLTSRPDPQDAIDLMHNSHKMCAAGGMNLRKYASNDESVNAAIPPELRAPDLHEFKNITTGPEPPVAGTLGMGWSRQTDTLRYLLTLVQKPHTRRGYLSSLSSIYDPLGLIGPVLLIGRILLQQLCLQKFQWDDIVPENIQEKWGKWYEQLAELKELNIPRCMRVHALLPLICVILHVFVDASLHGYGVCCYAQLNEGPESDVNLVYARSRVAPTKAVTIPRLELHAAVLGVKTAEMVRKELKYDNMKIQYYSDSKAALAYMANEFRRFHPFVANRVGFIREHTDLKDWHYVKSEDNPADLASRGCSVKELAKSEIWWAGPAFLKMYVREQVAVVDFAKYLDPEDPEIKRQKSVMATSTSSFQSSLYEKLSTYSAWPMARSVMARILQFKTLFIKKWRPSLSSETAEFDTALQNRAEHELIKLSQRRFYGPDVAVLSQTPYPDGHSQVRERKKKVSRASNLYKLDAYVDQDKLLRVGGRLKRSYFDKNTRHPLILSRRCPLVTMLIWYHHRRAAHGGRNTTLSALRLAGYWICGGRAAVGSLVASCAHCRRVRGRPMTQMMAELPEDRTHEGPPFTYASVDFFGPYVVRRARSEHKRYGCLFVCQASRAVHLELTWTLTTDSFLHAYRRFVSRRGHVRSLRSDQGTNLVGVSSELTSALREMDDDVIRRELLKHECDWLVQRFNPPRASHMGGSWERLIRIVRNALDGILVQHSGRLTDEELLTLFTEAEAVVNCRPMAVVDQTDSDADIPLTPFHLLTLKDRAVAPLPGIFQATDVYTKRRWRTVQYLATQFWRRWREQYLTDLQVRNKWQFPSRNAAVGDVVLEMDENLPRNRWNLGRISEVIRSPDGLIRTVKVIIGGVEFERPVSKLILLVEGNRD